MSHVDDGTLHAWLDGELSPAEIAGVEAHVAQCPACRGRLEEERALIARADELLGLAVPPARPLPPFRPGDLTPPARLWWRVRLPLAWAATIALALGTGVYVGSETATDVASERPRPAQPPAQRASDLAPRSAVGLEQPRRAPSAAPASPPARPTLERKRAQRAVAPLRADQPETAVAPRPREGPAAGALTKVAASRPLTLDSARALLGADPLAVPGLPIRGIYQARRIGYSAVVVVEQALDSSTVIEVITARESTPALEAVVASAAAGPDTAARQALPVPAAAPTDSAARVRREANGPRPRAPDAFADRLAAPPFYEVRGPLTADSLAALRRRLQPLRP